MFRFNKLKARYLWILFAVCVVLCAGMVFLCTKINNRKLTMVILIVVFLLTSFVFQAAISKSMMIKTKKKMYNPKNVNFIGVNEAEDRLLKDGYNKVTFSYGVSFTKVLKRVCYKVLFVNNIENYYNPTDDDKSKPTTKNIDNCLKMISIEVFLDTNDTLLERVGEFSIEAEKVLFKGFYLDESLIDPNFMTFSDKFKDEYESMLDTIGITYEEDNNK